MSLIALAIRDGRSRFEAWLFLLRGMWPSTICAGGKTYIEATGDETPIPTSPFRRLPATRKRTALPPQSAHWPIYRERRCCHF